MVLELIAFSLSVVAIVMAVAVAMMTKKRINSIDLSLMNIMEHVTLNKRREWQYDQEQQPQPQPQQPQKQQKKKVDVSDVIETIEDIENQMEKVKSMVTKIGE